MKPEPSLEAIPRCDYEGSRYQAEFWTAARSYEDQAERHALRRLLPPRGHRIVEIGAGAGRLADLYSGYREVYLVDYAQSQLEQARARWGADPRVTFVQGDIYNLPFPDDYFDTVVTVRVLHHVKELRAALGEIARITAPRGMYITEYANKRNLKAVLRYALGRGKPGENPFSPEPFEFVPLNLDFHPRYVQQAMEGEGFLLLDELAASFFRLPLLKRIVPSWWLARADSALQRPLAPLRLTPSIFLRGYLPGDNTSGKEQGWRCPICHGQTLHPRDATDIMSTPAVLVCQDCGHEYPVEDGIYLFRADIETGS